MESMEAPRIDEVLGEIQGLEGKDLAMWLMNLTIILGLTAGVCAFILPRVFWNLKTLELPGPYFRQLSLGLSLLIVLYNVYTFNLRHKLHSTREELVRQLLRAETAQALSFLDPLTQVHNRRFLERSFSKEKRRAERLGSDLTFLLIDLDGFKSVNTQFGHVIGDRVLKEVGALLNETLRNSDAIVRYGGDEFVVVMPDCNEEQGRRAIERIGQKVDKWNDLNLIPNYQMSLSCGLATYEKGMNIEVLLEAADRRMYEDKGRKRH